MTFIFFEFGFKKSTEWGCTLANSKEGKTEGWESVHSGSTYLQRQNKTCHGQTKAEVVRPLSAQRHRREKITEKDKAMMARHRQHMD